jgi:hypothetical protein
MKRAVACAVLWGLIWSYGCGSDDGSPPSGNAGKGGSAGSAGRGGSGGTGGMDGSVGASGSAGTAGTNGGSGASGSAGMDAGDGSAGAGGMGGAPGQAYAYLLWTKSDTARIQILSATTGDPVEEKTLTVPAAKGTGWSARDLDVLHDGTRRLLWTRADQGESFLQVLDRRLNVQSEVVNNASSPPQGWFTTAYAKLADGTGRLVWFNPTVKNAIAWPLVAADTLGAAAKKTYTPPTSAGDWVPVAFTQASDGTARLLWGYAGLNGSAPTVAQAEIWVLDPLEDQATSLVVTHEANWFARSYHVERGGRVRMLWGDDTAAKALVCSYKSDAGASSVPTAQGFGDDQCRTYEGGAGWVARTFTREDCAWDDAACPVPCVDDVKLPLDPEAPARLSETGLYSNIANKTLATYAKVYQPEFPLWSDGADKVRHIYIPKCSKVDSTDMDHWVFPVGTRVWKQFTRNGVVVETRLIHRYGPRPEEWIFAPYQWNSGNTEAAFVQDGVPNANGTTHDIPSTAMCVNCHEKLVDRVLSFSAFQLSHSLPGETMASISAAGILTNPRPQGVTVPGNATERAALGYLHSNCGNCHNSSFTQAEMRMRLLTTQTTVQTTDAYVTGRNVATASFNCMGAGVGTCDRIEPGNAARSAVIMRMADRGSTSARMPPIASELAHTEGIAAVSAWINALTP